MKPGIGSKAKGSSFELKVCKALSAWLTNGERTDILRRTVGSGAQYTRAAGNSGEPGDIGPNDPEAFPFTNRFVIECKHWKKIELIDMLWGKKHGLRVAMDKVRQEARQANREWVLIARQNLRPTLVFIASTPQLRYHAQQSVKYHQLFNGTVLLFRLDDFLTLKPPHELPW